jgi:hypothetical protein
VVLRTKYGVEKMIEIPQAILDFIANNTWTFAKTMPQWPHCYIVKDRVDQKMFVQFVTFIREHGYKAKWHTQKNIYLNIGDYKYWTMGAPIEETTIINRALLVDNKAQAPAGRTADTSHHDEH